MLLDFSRSFPIPSGTEAVLWDMDGVLIDSLGLDLTVCEELLRNCANVDVSLGRPFLRSIFAYSPAEFWRRIFTHIEDNFPQASDHFDEILDLYTHARLTTQFDLNPGIPRVIDELDKRGIRQAVVSNNPTADVRRVLETIGLDGKFELIIGNDIGSMRSKPAPDAYLIAADQLGIAAGKCVVVEDSLVGAEAGKSAGCFVVGVGTGANDPDELARSGFVDCVYSSLAEPSLSMEFGSPTVKTIETPNAFVSHMVEHVAWRLGTSIHLKWYGVDCAVLGQVLGEQISAFPSSSKQGRAFGMIDDGSAECSITLDGASRLDLRGTGQVEIGELLACRCEQLHNGKPLLDLLGGLASGLKASISITVCNFEDPHHTWEGVFRAVGIALSTIYSPPSDLPLEAITKHNATAARYGLETRGKTCQSAEVTRRTAETDVHLVVDFGGSRPNEVTCAVDDSINVAGLADLVDVLTSESGFTMQVAFQATLLSSSHVVCEDTGLVLGRALREIFDLRLKTDGVVGAGSSLRASDGDGDRPVRVGLSVEGRKFWRFVPVGEKPVDLRKDLILGHTAFRTLFTEDLDDFIDGLAGGLGCSIVIHVERVTSPGEAWRLIMQGVGRAIDQAFAPCPVRVGLIPGVKATLA